MTAQEALLPDGEFDAISAALTATERGRRFLDEYSRRRRDEAAARLLAAADRIERQARSAEAEREQAERAAEVVRQLAGVLEDLRPLADARMRARALEALGPRATPSGLERRFAALVRLEDG